MSGSLSINLRNSLNSLNKLAKKKKLSPPTYKPHDHYLVLTRSDYYYNLVLLRNAVKEICIDYMNNVIGALDIDLFMLTPSISSPMGPGSDSEAIPIKFGKYTSYLTDSSQFGFEPLVMNGFDKVFCYLPSMRGEDPDKRHLNQFFHCEIEVKGSLDKVVQIAEVLVKYLAQGLLECPDLINSLSSDSEKSQTALNNLAISDNFDKYTFDYAYTNLENIEKGKFTHRTPEGRDIPSNGELKLMESVGTSKPIWLTSFDRSRVPFYQKPDPKNTSTVLNADLLFPPIIEGAFGGEIIGSGQRQDSADEMYESLKMQKLSPVPYEWYIDLRRQDRYQITSGFGMGIERFIAWSLCLESIQDVILYPRLKNILTTP